MEPLQIHISNNNMMLEVYDKQASSIKQLNKIPTSLKLPDELLVVTDYLTLCYKQFRSSRVVKSKRVKCGFFSFHCYLLFPEDWSIRRIRHTLEKCYTPTSRDGKTYYIGIENNEKVIVSNCSQAQRILEQYIQKNLQIILINKETYGQFKKFI